MYRHPKNLPQKTLPKRNIVCLCVVSGVMGIETDRTGYEEIAVELSNFDGWLIMKAKRMMKNLRYIFEIAVSH